ncbi:putative acetyltransferase NATA1-like [Abeliophyllum distichum]|uniref:Acetyltransferase NATA1-like n=1 Tax=Abeliophyllum distichum TaxID=126358 RepID=A0ABD1U1L6_9LAMI
MNITLDHFGTFATRGHRRLHGTKSRTCSPTNKSKIHKFMTSTYQKFKNLLATPSLPTSASPPYMTSPTSINSSTKWMFSSTSPTFARPPQSPSLILSFLQTSSTFYFFAIFLLKLSYTSFLPITQNAQFTLILKSIHLKLSIEDPEREVFRSKAIDVNVLSNDVIVGGFVLFF